MAPTTAAPTFGDFDWKAQEEQDDDNIRRLMSQTQEQGEDSTLFDQNRPLETGDKAEDAQDYEDISDDDLPEEEDAAGAGEGDLPGLTDDMGTSHDTDDLFGDGRGSSPFDQFEDDEVFQPDGTTNLSHINGNLTLPSIEPEIDLRELNFPEHYQVSNQDPSIPAPAESVLELVKQSWPKFEQGTICNFNELLPPQLAHYI